jgi:hypothetical protein
LLVNQISFFMNRRGRRGRRGGERIGSMWFVG